MAIVQFGITVTGLRGTVGGGTYSANKAGPYLKAWARSANQRSVLQTTQRNAIARHAQAWRALSSANQTNWETYAADPAQELTNSLGEPYFTGGFQWYVKMSAALVQAGLTPIATAPALTTPGTSIINSFNVRSTASGLNCFINFNGADPTLTLYKSLFIAVSYSAGRQVQPARPRFMVNGIPDGSRNLFFTTQINAVFGTIPIGLKAFGFVRAQNTEGRRGPVLAMTTTVTT